MLDGDHYKTQELVNQLMNNAQMQHNFDLMNCFKPRFFQEGDKYCFQYGELPNDCFCGFGDTPYEAMMDFQKSFYQQKAQKFK